MEEDKIIKAEVVPLFEPSKKVVPLFEREKRSCHYMMFTHLFLSPRPSFHKPLRRDTERESETEKTAAVII